MNIFSWKGVYMKQIDFKSFIIGVLSTALMLLFLGAEDKNKFGDIIVNSITIHDDGHGGFITAYNKDQKRTLYLGTGSEGNGYVQTYNKYEQPTSYIGSNREMDGVILLNDRYGALGFTQSGKE